MSQVIDKITRFKIADGEAGIRQTLKVMGNLVKKYRRNPVIYNLARTLTANVPQKSWIGEVYSLFYFVRDEIRYVKDPVGIESVQMPTITLQIGSGDCDDKVTLLCSLLESIGHPTRFVAVMVKGSNRYSHVYCQTKVGKRWISLETTENWEPGQSSDQITKRLAYYPR